MKKYLLMLLALLVGVAVASGIYKWVDETGVTHYSQVPPPSGEAQEIRIEPSTSTSAPVPGKPRSTWQEKEQEFQRRRMEREQAERTREAQEKREAAWRQSRCQQLQQNLHVL